MPDWLVAFQALTAGTSTGKYRGESWHLTVKRSDDQRHWLYAEQAGGKDFVSANLYITSDGRALLKPCEMAEEKVIAFLNGFRPSK